MKADFSFPTAFWLGAGRVRELPKALRAAGISRPLLVADGALAQGAAFAQVRAALATTNFALFAQVRAAF